MSGASTTILIATENLADAKLITEQLSKEFRDITVSTDPKLAVQDFDRHKPRILILAFDQLEKAERYCLALYRRSNLIHSLPHRTLVLCNGDDLLRTYELCANEQFDDYMLFWPMTNDPYRLRMLVHQALNQIERASAPTAGEFAAQVRRIADLEAVIANNVARGSAQLNVATRSLATAEQDIGAVLDGFSRRLARGEHSDLVEVRDRAGLELEINRLKREEIARPFRSVEAAVQPVRQWAGALQSELAPHVQSARALQSLAERVSATVLVVDDDTFQHKLLKQMLAQEPVDLMFAASAAEGFAALCKRRPNLILMDVELPDMNGIEATQRITAIEQYSKTPVIMITGHSGKEAVVESLKAGAKDFVVKPFDRSNLLAKMRKFLDGGPAA